jgi:predicted NBD/HSP70 family sugar kinase
MGVGAGALVNVFNPEVVIFGGTLAEVFTAAADIVRESVDAVALAPAMDGVRLVTPAFGADSTLIGAGELAFAPLLADPLRETFRRDAS